MKKKRAAICALFVLGAVGAGVGVIHAQQATAPTENKGLSVKSLTAVDLGPEIEGMAGRQLRMRLIVIEPGGILALHNHKDRPATDYVLRGSLIDHRGDTEKEYKAGDSIFETKEVTHWLENRGTVPVEFVSIDVFKTQ